MELTLEYEDEHITLKTYKSVMFCEIRGSFELRHVDENQRVLERLAKRYPGQVLAISVVSPNAPASDRATRKACSKMLSRVESDVVAWGIYEESHGLMATVAHRAFTFIMALFRRGVSLRLSGRDQDVRAFMKTAVRSHAITAISDRDIDPLWSFAFDGARPSIQPGVGASVHI